MGNFSNRPSLDATETRELMEELELNEAVSVQKLRDQAATQITADIVVRPADLSNRSTVEASGKARDFQQLGVTTVLDQPILPGRVVHLTFTAENYEIDPLLAICNRCAVFNHDVFEAHFQFLQPQELSYISD